MWMMRKSIATRILSVALTFSPAPAPAQTAQAVQRLADIGDFKLVNGQTIHACKLGCRPLGRLNAANRTRFFGRRRSCSKVRA
jgi:hypothetical protein